MCVCVCVLWVGGSNKKGQKEMIVCVNISVGVLRAVMFVAYVITSFQVHKGWKWCEIFQYHIFFLLLVIRFPNENPQVKTQTLYDRDKLKGA